jgi:putative tricarboxylic transport membrane protein
MLHLEMPHLFPQMVFTLLLADICLFFSALVLMRPIAFLLKIHRGYLMPAILAVSCMGAFAINLSYFDFYVMLVSGGVGYILKVMKYPAAPIILGLILGRMIDYNFRTTLIISDGSFAPFVTHPISCIFLLLTAAIVLKPLVVNLFEKWRRKPVRQV